MKPIPSSFLLFSIPPFICPSHPSTHTHVFPSSSSLPPYLNHIFLPPNIHHHCNKYVRRACQMPGTLSGPEYSFHEDTHWPTGFLTATTEVDLTAQVKYVWRFQKQEQLKFESAFPVHPILQYIDIIIIWIRAAVRETGTKL